MPDQDDSISTYILDELARLADRDDLITSLCLRLNIVWADAETLVERIERENEVLLRKRKSPLLLVLSILCTGAGLVWALVSFYGIAAPVYEIYKTHGGALEGLAWFHDFWLFFPSLLAGSGLAVGGLFGLMRSIRDLRGEESEISLF